MEAKKMNFPRLDIKTYNSNILIEKVQPKIEITGQVGNFSIEKEKRVFEIDKKNDKLVINNYPPKKAINFKRPEDLRQDISSTSKNEYMKGLAEIGDNKDLLLKIENKNVSAIKEIAKKKAYSGSDVSINISYFPQEPIKIDVEEGHFDINYKPEKIKTNIEKTLDIQVERGKVNIDIDRYPKVEINVVGENIDFTV